MKNSFLYLLVAGVVFASCAKSETVNSVKEVSFEPASIPATRAAVATTAFPDDNVIYVSASNNKTKFFEGKTFKKDGTVWKNFEGAVQTPLFWPLGGAGSFDFLAYSTTLDATAVWGDGDPAT